MTDGIYAALACGVFALGYIAGRLDTIAKILANKSISPQPGFFAKDDNKSRKNHNNQDSASASIQVGDIDTSIYVGAVATDNLIKTTGATLGTTSTTEDNINQSVSRLAQLKAK